MNSNISVDLAENSYDIEWNSSFDSTKEWVNAHKNKHKNGVVTNDLIYDIYKDTIESLFEGFHIFKIPDGESFKNMSTIESLAENMLENGFNRQSTLWAFGGGVIGDITGFLASMYMRGIEFFQVPFLYNTSTTPKK